MSSNGPMHAAHFSPCSCLFTGGGSAWCIFDPSQKSRWSKALFLRAKRSFIRMIFVAARKLSGIAYSKSAIETISIPVTFAPHPCPQTGSPLRSDGGRGEGGGGGVDTPDYFTVSYGELTRATSVTNRSSHLNLKVFGLVFFCKNKNGFKIYQPSLEQHNDEDCKTKTISEPARASIAGTMENTCRT